MPTGAVLQLGPRKCKALKKVLDKRLEQGLDKLAATYGPEDAFLLVQIHTKLQQLEADGTI